MFVVDSGGRASHLQGRYEVKDTMVIRCASCAGKVTVEKRSKRKYCGIVCARIAYGKKDKSKKNNSFNNTFFADTLERMFR